MVVVAGWVVDSLLLWLVGAMVGLTVVVVESVGAFALGFSITLDQCQGAWSLKKFNENNNLLNILFY